MAEEQNKERPWWKKRRLWGIATATLGGALILVPGAPIAVAIGTLPITWPMIGVVVTNIGSAVFGYGKGAKDERVKKDNK